MGNLLSEEVSETLCPRPWDIIVKRTRNLMSGEGERLCQRCIASPKSSSATSLSSCSLMFLVALPRGHRRADHLWQITPQPLYSRQKDECCEAAGGELSHAILGCLIGIGGTRGKRIEDASKTGLAPAGWRLSITKHQDPISNAQDRPMLWSFARCRSHSRLSVDEVV